MTNETQETMMLFAKLMQSRYFMTSVWMTLGKRRSHDFANTKGKYRLLNLLSEQDGLTNAEIVELLDIRPSSVSLQVKGLEDEGYVSRQASAADKRVSLIYLTDKGRQVIATGNSETDSISEDILAGLSASEIAELQRLLTKITKNIDGQKMYDEQIDRNMHFQHQNHKSWNRSRFPW